MQQLLLWVPNWLEFGTNLLWANFLNFKALWEKLEKSLMKLRGGPKVCAKIVPNLCKFDHPQP
jgi:hypothetical protein